MNTKKEETILDDVDRLSQAVQFSSATPDEDFKRNLLNELSIQIDDNPFNLIKFIKQTMQAKNKKTALAVAGVALGLGAITLGVFLFSANGIRPANKSAEEIFAAMINANASTNPVPFLQAESDSSDQKMAIGSTLIAPQEDKTYSSYESTSVRGPKGSTCEAYIPYGLSSSTVYSASYYSKENGSFSKYVVKDGTGNIISFNLSNSEYSYEYNGGSFAVRMPAVDYSLFLKDDLVRMDAQEDGTTSSDKPTSSEDTPVAPGEIRIEDYFGPDAQVLGQETINGKDYYVVSWSYDSYCGEGRESVKVITKTWVDSENFSYFKEEIYSDSINSSNLVVTNQHANVNTKKEFAEVQSEFVFDFNVEIIDIDPEQYSVGSDAYIAAVEKMLKDNSIIVLKPADTEMKLQGYYSDKLNLPNPNEYRFRRDFYSSGSTGEKMFRESGDLYTMQAGNTYLSTSYNKTAGDYYFNVSTEVYGLDMTDADIENMLGDSIKSESFTKSIDGNNVQVKLIDATYTEVRPETSEGSGFGSAPDSGASMPGSCIDCYNTYALVFEFDGHKYLVRFDGKFTKDEVKNYLLNSNDASVPAELSSLIDEIKALPKQGPIIAL